MGKEVVSVSGGFSNVSVWEVGFLPRLYNAVEGGFNSLGNDSTYDLIKCGEKGDWPKVTYIVRVFVSFC